MRGAELAAGLLCFACGLMLAFAPRRAVLPALLALFLGAGAGLIAGAPMGAEFAFAGCWMIIVVMVAMIHLQGGVPLVAAIAATVLGGVWAGAVVAVEGKGLVLLAVVPVALVVIPARQIVQRGWGIGVKVVSSWLVAVAVLAALLPVSTATPGYVPDHMN